jgi:hypothetical protein
MWALRTALLDHKLYEGEDPCLMNDDTERVLNKAKRIVALAAEKWDDVMVKNNGKY